MTDMQPDYRHALNWEQKRQKTDELKAESRQQAATVPDDPRATTTLISKPAVSKSSPQLASSDTSDEDMLVERVKDKYDLLNHQYQEDILAVTCTAEEFKLLACYRDAEKAGGNGSVLECADLLAKYANCVKSRY